MKSKFYFLQIILIHFLLIVFKTKGFGINLMKLPDNDHSQVVCTIALLKKYFNSGEPLSGAVLYMSLTTASMHTQKCLLDAMHSMTDFPWSIVIRDPKALKSLAVNTAVLHEKPQCYFVVIENLEDEDLEDIFEDWKRTLNWNPLAQFVVHLASVEETDEEMTELMIEILLSFMNKKIYNVNVIAKNEENGYYYGKTVFPYHPDNNCGNRVISIETLDVCDYQEEEKLSENDNDEEDEENLQEENPEVERNDENYDGEYDNDNKKDHNTNDDEINENGNGKRNDDDENENAVDDGGNGIDEENNKNDIDEESVNENELNGNFSSNEDINSQKEIDKNNNENKVDGDENNKENKDKQSNFDENFTKIDNKVRETEKDKETNGGGKNDVNLDSTDITYEDVSLYDDTVDQNEKSTKSKNNSENINEKASFTIYDGNDEGSKHFRENFNNKLNENVEDEMAENIIRNYARSNFQTDIDIIDNNNKEVMSKKNDKSFRAKKVNPSTYRNRINKFKKTKSQNESESQQNVRTHKRRYKRESDIDLNNTIENVAPSDSNLYVEEIYRALFLDKFPKDLSGCSLIAAFRPYEPYIFREIIENKDDGDDEDEADTQDEVEELNYNENVNVNKNYVNNEAFKESDNNSNDYESTDVAEENKDDSILDTAYDSVSSENELSKLNGIEYKLLQTIGECLHISIDLQVENRNPYLLFQQLIDGDIEMVIGGIDEDPSISQFVSTTIPYHQDDLTWCVAKARHSYNLFNFLASFSPIAWLLTFMFAVIAAFIINLMQKMLKLRLQHLRGYFGTLFRIFGIVFSQSVPLVKMPTPLRMTFAMAFFLGFIFINAYQSFLISTLTTPKSAYQISRVEEIYQHRMKIMGSVENVRHLSKPGKVFKYIREKFQMCYNIEECLQKAAENERLAVAVSRQHSFYNPRIPRNQLYCFDRNENLYVYLVTMLLPKKFHLLHKINPVIQYVIESGHMQKWARDLDMRRHILEERNRVNEDAVRSLTLGQVAGSFLFTGVLLGIALIILILECWVHKLATRQHRRTRIKIIKFLHRKFQPT